MKPFGSVLGAPAGHMTMRREVLGRAYREISAAVSADSAASLAHVERAAAALEQYVAIIADERAWQEAH